jgi:hypothetical protein
LKRACLNSLATSIMVLWVSCIFDTRGNDEPLTMTCINPKTDTLSVFPQLRFVFSAPLMDSSVSLAFSPPTSARYAAFLNATHDTLTLNVMEMLDGNTKYVVRLAQPVTSKDGVVLGPSQDSLAFVTYPREHEPNDEKDLADTLTSIIFGTVSNVADVDAFFCTDTKGLSKASGVFMQSINSQDSFYIVDSLSRVFSLGNQIKPIDTIFFTDSMRRPLYAFVVSRIKGSEGDYELGIVSK